VVALGCLLLAPAPARAYHEGRHANIFQTGHALHAGEWLLGPLRVGYGAFDWLSVSTYTVPWLLGVPSLGLKSRFWANQEFSLAASISWVKLDLNKLGPKLGGEAQDVVFKVVPLELAASWHLGSVWVLSAAFQHNQVAVEGNYDEDGFNGAAGSTNTQWVATGEYRLNKSWAFLLRFRQLLAMKVSGTSITTVHPDGFTSIQIHASGGSDDLAGMKFPSIWSLTPAIHYSSRYFNLEGGVVVGNWNLPLVNFMLPTRTVVPELDLYWRF
jgi:hypothetical protein